MTRQVYRIPSASFDGHTYKVVTQRGKPVSCECKSWHYRQTCRHADLVRLALLQRVGTEETAYDAWLRATVETAPAGPGPLPVDDLYA